jgi:hypothetical protein
MEVALATFPFNPPLQLAGIPTVYVRSLDDAAGVLREYAGRRPVTRDSVLRRLNAASTEQETGEAAKSFRWWAEQEGLLLSPKQVSAAELAVATSMHTPTNEQR